MSRGTPSASGPAIAQQVLEGFQTYRRRFRQLTTGARDRFQRAAWHEAQQASVRRTNTYADTVTEVCAALRARFPLPAELALWRDARAAYIPLCAELPDWELAETFFNSVYCRLWAHEDIRDANLFVHSAWPSPPAQARIDPCHDYRPGEHGGWRPLLRTLLAGHHCDLPWQDLERDLDRMLQALQAELPEALATDFDAQIRMLHSTFYRNKGAYLVGCLQLGERRHPFVPVILNDEAGAVYVDNLILDEDALSVVFSFTRSYFMVDMEAPWPVVQLLSTVLPAKKRYELYSSIGQNRHGKTELYRDLVAHLDQSEDRFERAPGIPGTVMAVFTLRSYQTVFKIIKDRFPPQKEVTREQVMAAYSLVKMHDRVGRMADTQEFSNLRLPRSRFDPEMLAELLQVAARNVRIEGDEVVIAHCYTEREMMPLNLYLANADEHTLATALNEFGNAIRQLAAANIFPGDMLLKNFGVTRHGRVVFYDYDEICYLTDVNFRDLPQAASQDQQLAGEPWFAVGPQDVFPQEFAHFMFPNPRIQALFRAMHGDLFEPAYWRSLQAAIRAGQVMDVYPYPREHRFSMRFGQSQGTA